MGDPRARYRLSMQSVDTLVAGKWAIARVKQPLVERERV